jgi:hypothetical protein
MTAMHDDGRQKLPDLLGPWALRTAWSASMPPPTWFAWASRITRSLTCSSRR